MATCYIFQASISNSFSLEQTYFDNGTEYRGNQERHAFMKLCAKNKIEQRFTKVKHPYANGKAERIIT